MRPRKPAAVPEAAPAFDRRRGPLRPSPVGAGTPDRRKRKPGFAGLFAAIFGTSEIQRDESIRAGLTPAVWSELREKGYTTSELAAVVGVSEKTISRKQTSHETLDIVQGDRTIRLAHITLQAENAFHDIDKAMRWLRKPNRVLRGEKPIDLIATEPGAALVRRALGTIEYGGVA